MALEFICSSEIVEGKRIVLPRESFNGEILKYYIKYHDKDKREIIFFYADNGYVNIFALNTWTAPKGAREMEFSVYKKHGQNILQVPAFYDVKGNLLKIGNR